MANTNNCPVTFSPEALMAIIKTNPEVLKELMPLLQPIPAAPQILADPLPAAPKNANQMEQEVIQAFAKRNIHGVVPRQDVFTKFRWAQAGYKIAEGQKAVRVRGMNLYHFSQAQSASKTELDEYFAGVEQWKAERNGTASKPPVVSPVQVPITAMPECFLEA